MNTKTKESLKYWYRGLASVIITAVIVLVFGYIWRHDLNELLYVSYLNKGNLLMLGVYTVLMIIFINAFGGYKIGVGRISNVIMSQTLGIVAVNAIEIIITMLMVGQVAMLWRVVLAYVKAACIQTLCIFFLTWLLIVIYRRIYPPYRVLHICGEYENSLPSKMNARGDKYIVEGELSCYEDLDVIEHTMQNYDAVLINDVPSETRNRILKLCYEHGKRVYFTPKISDIIIRGSEELQLFDTPVYYCRNVGLSLPQSFCKRLGDIIIALIGIIITSPIMLVTAIAIHSYDKGPVFYKQTRCTIGGKEFQVMKFRSMITDAEKDGVARLSTENDDRITPVGKFIRATRIDELPQFFNILEGDMSVVGPRPERPELIQEYYEELPEFAYRLRVKAGLTGYAQVYGKYNTTSYDKLKLDLTYVENYSLLLDIQIILLTIKVIFQKEATEGLEEGETNAAMGKKK